MAKINPDLSVKIGRLKLKNPVIAASGTFGYGTEWDEFFDPGILGAIVTKTITLKPRPGNPMPRTCETAAGMLNAIGMENVGLQVFLREKLPALTKIDTVVIVSIAGANAGEYGALAAALDNEKRVDALEVNISCPNLSRRGAGRRLISQNSGVTYQVVRRVRQATKKPIITKLSPNVTDITVIGRRAEEAGSDAVALINTITGMAVDLETGRPKLANVVGGLSGPAIKPVALRMVWEVSRAVKIPVVGVGGITTSADALEFILAGAVAVEVGTANFVDPMAMKQIVAGIGDYLKAKKINRIGKLKGTLKT